MTDTQQSVGSTVASTALQAAEALIPTALGVAATADPRVALALQLAPIAIQFLQSAQQLTQAGLLPPSQLASLWASIGNQIQTTHNAWAAMDEKNGQISVATGPSGLQA